VLVKGGVTKVYYDSQSVRIFCNLYLINFNLQIQNYVIISFNMQQRAKFEHWRVQILYIMIVVIHFDNFTLLLFLI
jgi:hypothetical protein